jgi:hypothetical protein
MLPQQPNSGPNRPFSTDAVFSSTPSFSLIIRYIGIGVMLFGIFIAWQVVQRAWALLETSTSIVVPFSNEIEAQTGMNRFMTTFAKPTLTSLKNIQAATAPRSLNPTSAINPSAAAPITAPTPSSLDALPEGEVRVSYFAAWTLIILLLGIILRISIALISVGGRLANETAQRQEVANLLKIFIAEAKKP